MKDHFYLPLVVFRLTMCQLGGLLSITSNDFSFFFSLPVEWGDASCSLCEKGINSLLLSYANFLHYNTVLAENIDTNLCFLDILDSN